MTKQRIPHGTGPDYACAVVWFGMLAGSLAFWWWAIHALLRWCNGG